MDLDPALLWIPLAGGSVAGTYVVGFWALRRVRRIPASIAAALALALLVCIEAAVVNTLSLVGAVTRGAVFVAQVSVTVAGAGLVAWSGRVPHALPRRWLPPLPRGSSGAAIGLSASLALLALVSALRYAPNNGDSMTYHLARVAHWIQHGSVASYPSGSLRQNIMMPGAEYVLLVLQVISGSDRLAPLLQTGAYLILISAGPALSRLSGAPRWAASMAAPAIAALPLAVLQASSTQNDLVAAVMTVAAVGSMATLRAGGRMLWVDLVLMAMACIAAVLVKSSALVAGAPLLALGLVRAVNRWWGAPVSRRSSIGRLALGLALGAAVALILLAPELARRGTPARAAGVVVPTYPLMGEWLDRSANTVRGVFHDMPVPRRLADALDARLPWRAAALVPAWPQTAPHEDFAGNPFQVMVVGAALLTVAVRFHRVPRRGLWAMASAVTAWILFHWILRDNEYLSRLQLPLFAIVPVFLAAIPAVPQGRHRSVMTAVLASFAALAVSWAGLVAVANRLRPPFEPRMESRIDDYYRNGPLLKEPQRTTLAVARSIGCRRIGLFMGESGFDYPLTWQAMRQGMEVRHVFGMDGWPCLVYFEPISFSGWNLAREPLMLRPESWNPVAANAAGVFLFRRVGEPPGAP